MSVRACCLAPTFCTPFGVDDVEKIAKHILDRYQNRILKVDYFIQAEQGYFSQAPRLFVRNRLGALPRLKAKFSQTLFYLSFRGSKMVF
jgi:hypothetical protein